MPNKMSFSNWLKNSDEYCITLIVVGVLSICVFIMELISIFIWFEFKQFLLTLFGFNSDEYSNGFFNFLLTYNPSEGFFAAIVGLFATLISIAIPISIVNMADSLKPYKDKDIQQMFLGERTFKQMLTVIILLAFSLFTWFFITKNMITGFLLLFFGILSLIFFYQFIRRVIEYITATDDVVLEKLWFNLENILHDE